jgi:hypothetical protein
MVSRSPLSPIGDKTFEELTEAAICACVAHLPASEENLTYIDAQNSDAARE